MSPSRVSIRTALSLALLLAATAACTQRNQPPQMPAASSPAGTTVQVPASPSPSSPAGQEPGQEPGQLGTGPMEPGPLEQEARDDAPPANDAGAPAPDREGP